MTLESIPTIITDVLNKDSFELRTIMLGLPEIKKEATKKKLVAVFQNELASHLCPESKLDEITEVPLFQKRGSLSGSRDRADILCKDYPTGCDLIIELDATRADQVAKKMLSRFCYATQSDKPVTYVALLYPGPPSSNPEECKKYFIMGGELLERINPLNKLIGFIIEDLSVKEADFVYLSKGSVSYDKALDPEYYKDYLLTHGVKSPGSIECYKRPIHVILDNYHGIPYEKFLIQLRNKSSSPKEALNLVSETYYHGNPVKGNTKSYWGKYVKFLHTFLPNKSL